ncbi:MAG TPA: hypothetical protein VM779_00370 [Thermoanaerobaculia bacterium]|nr:hypothetical protein [Thermoanaerobaculia bacterium]
MKRFGFLPVFFIVLGVVFATLVFVRIRSYRAADVQRAGAPLSIEQQAAEAARATSLPMETIEAGAASARRADYDSVPLLDPPPPFLLAQPDATAPAQIRAPRTQKAAPAPVPRPKQQQPGASVARPGTAPSAPAARPPAQESSRTAPRQAEVERGSAESGRNEPAADPNDPTSDSTPPQLATIEFTPSQIADGEETVLVIQATDDLSGIRSISGTILAPSGAVQGFACQRDPATNRYIARVIVPKDAAEGVWSVNYLNLMDNASNAAALTAARGGLPPTASFRVVSSRPDSEGPSLQAIWLDRRSMRGGEKNLVFVRAEDDQSGVNLVSGIFQSPSRQARVGFVCRAAGDGTWSCELSAPACADCGEWQLEQLQMQDKANNMTTLRASQNELVAAVRVDISSDMCDSTPPLIERVMLDRPAVSNVEQTTINITATLSDDACGVLSVSGQATGPQTGGVPPRLYFSFTPAGDPHTWSGKIVVPRLASKGVWRVSFLQALDRGQNLKTYTANDPLLAGVSFLVE